MRRKHKAITKPRSGPGSDRRPGDRHKKPRSERPSASGRGRGERKSPASKNVVPRPIPYECNADDEPLIPFWKLTSLVEQPDVRSAMEYYFSFPRGSFKADVLAPPITKNYGTVGTAFDYLLRFMLARRNPNVTRCSWIAYQALDQLRSHRTLLTRARQILNQAEFEYAAYGRTGEIPDSLLESTLQLAQLDVVFRAGWISDRLGVVNLDDVTDLRALSMFVPQDFGQSINEKDLGRSLNEKNGCVLNPILGSPVSGVFADADLIIDGVLIDIKTTKYCTMKIDHFRQLIGYYSLWAMLEGTNYFDFDIDSVGVYFSRCGQLVVYPVELLRTDKPLLEWLYWFKRRARRPY